MVRILGERIQTVLFDKDGTLIDLPSIWLPWLYDIEAYLAQSKAAGKLGREELERAFGVQGEPPRIEPTGPLAMASIEESKTIVAYLLYRLGIAWDAAVLLAAESVGYANKRQTRSNTVRPVAGVKEFLQTLRAYGVKLGVLTADDTHKARQHLEVCGLLKYFDFVIGGDQVQNGKPHPDMAFLARDRYGIDLEETIYIGDTNADMELGKRAGVKASIGLVTQGDAAVLRQADYIIHRYDQLAVEYVRKEV